MRLPTHARAGLLFVALLSSVAAHAAEDPQPRSVQVSGAGESRAAPDRAQLNAGVFAVDPDVQKAEAKVDAVVRRFVAAARKLGASDAQIQTAGISIQPEYRWNQDSREQDLIGYRVARDIVVRVDALDRLADFLQAATEAGVNQMQPPQLESSKAAELREQALAAAARDARRRAEVLATTLDAQLGPVRSIEAIDFQVMQPMAMKSMAAAAPMAEGMAADDMGLSTGEITISVSVNARFDLLPD